MIFFTSDTHFGHKSVIEYCNRPFASVDDMQEGLIERWNSKVSVSDTVYVLGDFSFLGPNKTQPILERLHGKKILIWGNHDDRRFHRLAQAGFSEVFHQVTLEIPTISNPYRDCRRDAFGIKKPERFKLCHFPYAPSWFEQKWKGFDDRYRNLRPSREKEIWLLHGHVHQMWKVLPTKRMINVGVDVWNYTPVSETEILSIVD